MTRTQAAASHLLISATLAAEVSELLKLKQLSWQDVAVVPFDVKTQSYAAVVRLNPVAMLKVLPESPR